MHVLIWHKWKGMLTWNRPLKMKHLKKGGKIYYQWNHESIYVINFVSHKNDFDDLNLKWVLSKSWSWFVKLNELKLNDCDLHSLYSWYDFYAILCIHERFISSPNYFLLDIPYVMIWIHEIFINLFWCIQMKSYDHAW